MYESFFQAKILRNSSLTTLYPIIYLPCLLQENILTKSNESVRKTSQKPPLLRDIPNTLCERLGNQEKKMLKEEDVFAQLHTIC